MVILSCLVFPWETKSETFIQAVCQATLHLKGVYHKPITWNMEQLHIIIPTTPPPGQDVMLCQGCTSSHNTVQNVLPNPFCLSLKHRQLLCTHIGENLIPGTKIKRTDLIKKRHSAWKLKTWKSSVFNLTSKRQPILWPFTMRNFRRPAV